MNMWRASGSPIVTAEKLLGPDFYAGLSAEEKPAGVFTTKEEWDRHKAEVEKMARFHSKILRQLKAGTRTGRVVAKFRETGLPTEKQ